MRIFTIGYERRTLDDFIQTLCDAQVEMLVDVRLTPISRKRGFSKTALRTRCEAEGIAYRHQRELGNPKVNRVESNTTDECLQLYTDHMHDRWTEALGDLPAVAMQQSLALLCVERESCACHRSVVAKHLAERVDQADIVNL